MSVRTQPDDHSTRLTRTIGAATGALGSFPAISFSALIVIAWFIGVAFVKDGFGNNTYQLLINTGTTIVTFLMVFIIQNTQNRDGRAIQAKLDAQNEALRAIAARLGCAEDEDMLTRLVGVEDAPERVIKQVQDQVRSAAVASGRHGANTVAAPE